MLTTIVPNYKTLNSSHYLVKGGTFEEVISREGTCLGCPLVPTPMNILFEDFELLKHTVQFQFQFVPLIDDSHQLMLGVARNLVIIVYNRMPYPSCGSLQYSRL